MGSLECSSTNGKRQRLPGQSLVPTGILERLSVSCIHPQPHDLLENQRTCLDWSVNLQLIARTAEMRTNSRTSCYARTKDEFIEYDLWARVVTCVVFDEFVASVRVCETEGRIMWLPATEYTTEKKEIREQG